MSQVIVFAGCAFPTTPAGLVDTRKEVRERSSVWNPGERAEFTLIG
jgi:hypothetical protein